MDERMLLSGPAECLFLAINFSLRIALLSVSGKRLAASRLALEHDGGSSAVPLSSASLVLERPIMYTTLQLFNGQTKKFIHKEIK